MNVNTVANLGFKLELIKRYGTQIEAAKHIGINDTKLSRFIRGHFMPTPREWEKLEAALGKPLAHRLVKQRGPVIQGSK